MSNCFVVEDTVKDYSASLRKVADINDEITTVSFNEFNDGALYVSSSYVSYDTVQEAPFDPSSIVAEEIPADLRDATRYTKVYSFTRMKPRRIRIHQR